MVRENEIMRNENQKQFENYNSRRAGRSSPSPQKTPDATSNFKVYKELERIELS